MKSKVLIFAKELLLDAAEKFREFFRNNFLFAFQPFLPLNWRICKLSISNLRAWRSSNTTRIISKIPIRKWTLSSPRLEQNWFDLSILFCQKFWKTWVAKKCECGLWVKVERVISSRILSKASSRKSGSLEWCQQDSGTRTCKIQSFRDQIFNFIVIQKFSSHNRWASSFLIVDFNLFLALPKIVPFHQRSCKMISFKWFFITRRRVPAPASTSQTRTLNLSVFNRNFALAKNVQPDLDSDACASTSQLASSLERFFYAEKQQLLQE